MQTIKQYLAAVARIPRRRPPHSRALCQGGPWDGQTIIMDETHDGSTAVLSCGPWLGYYARERGAKRGNYVDAYGNSKIGAALTGPAIWYSIV